MSASFPENPLPRRAVLTGLAAAPAAAFATRAAAQASEVPGADRYLNVRGLSYVEDPEGTALVTGDGRRWSPYGVITPLHFGDLSSDDTDLIQAAVDYAATLSERNRWDSNVKGPFQMQAVVSGLNALYHVSGPVRLRAGNRNAVIRDFSIKAIPGRWESDGGKGRVGNEIYHPARSDFIFDARARATHLQFENLKLNCNDLCGGVRVRARSRVLNCFIKKCAGIGVLAAAGDVWVDRCIIKQYDQNDPEFYDPPRYTGIGVMCAESDLRVTHCVLNWLAECARIEGTNCTFAHCHIFNGCRGYLGTYAKQKGETETRGEDLNAALSTYFGRTIDDSVDFEPRPYHAGIVVTGPVSQDNSFDSIYFDNCHMEIYAHGVHFNEPKLGAKPNSSLWTSPIDYWFAVYPARDDDVPQIVIDEVMQFVESRPKRMVTFRDHPKTGHRWAEAYRALEQASFNLSSSDWGDRFRLDVPMVHLVGPGTAARPAVTYMAAHPGAALGFADPEATLSDRFGGQPLDAWESGKRFRLGQRAAVGENVYECTTRGNRKAGKRPPAHTAGVASDGRIDWAFAGRRDPVAVLFGSHGDRARIQAPNGQLVIGAEDAPAFRGAAPHAVAIRTGASGVPAAPEDADDLTIETDGDGGLSLAIPDGARASLTVSTPSDPNRFRIEFDDKAGTINFLVGGRVVQSMGG